MSDPIRVHQYGNPSRPTLVLVHGVTDAGTTWPDAVTHWERDWHLLSVSLRGHGESPRFPAARYGQMMQTLTDDLVTVLDGLPEPPVVVGHSLGGRTAVLAALERPELVKALVLEDPALADTTPERRRETQLWVVGVRGFAARREQEVARQLAAGWSATETQAWADSKEQMDLDMMANLDFGPMDQDAVLNQLTVPALVLAPRDSELVPADGVVTNPLVRVQRLDGVGHCVRRDGPQAYFRLVDAFLASL
ncbi:MULTISPECIES: alpha/beta fold hydrolase [unclassified Luteococcus]|uniref:alpha/beta fold hydrolase n=1 Tax=unclassified Luteococcus TaxID=2639923 RepID=UPI00313D3BAD